MAARKTTGKKSSGRKSSGRKTTARKSTARKSTTRKTAAKKSSSRKSTARKTSTRKSSSGTIPKIARGVEKAAKTPAGRSAMAAVKDIATAAIDAVAQTAKSKLGTRGKRTNDSSNTRK